jgi:eukaryotic-like serine/threonine-protein kinase
MDDGARLARLEELFHRLVDLPAAGRLAVLEPLGRTEPDLVAEVERLLARADGGRDLSAAGALVAAAGAATGGRVGPYRLLARIGQGGMGEVYRAERADGQYVQTVAVKVIRGGFATPELRQRFRFERQVLARLEHPNIARLLDGSVTADGSPYLVMEYVEGRPITDYCDGERLGLRPRLELFRTVCRAVEHAHRNLVVHRDLKPSNILVTAAGEVKLLDFGIAKLLAPDGEADAELTRTQAPLLTPGYASPEQVRGEAVTTATDVYALGLLLYELLAGRRAQRPDDSSLAALERAVCDQGQPRPSDALGAGDAEEVAARAAARGGARGGARLGRLRKQLRGDLDTIAAVALRKDPARRYASAQQLLDDLDRHLAGRPVLARPDTLGYRAAKFLRRHRLAAAASAAIAVAVVLGLVLALLGLARAQRAERQARAEAATAGQISAFLVDLFRANDPGEAQGETVTARELLDRGSERIGEQLAAQPAVRARLLGAMADAYQALGLFDPALELVRKELELARAEHGEASVEMGRALVAVGNLQAMKGDYRGSRESVERALAILERRAGPESADVADALAQLGRAHGQLGDLAPAAAALERAIAILERSSGPDHVRVWGPLNNLAIVYMLRGDAEAAEGLYRRSLAIAEREFGAEHPRVAQVLENLALVQEQLGDLEAAIATHEQALAIREKVLPPDHPHIAATLNNLGGVLVEQGDFVRAREVSERALGIRERALGPDHPLVASTKTNLGLALLGLGEREAARPLFESAIAAFSGAFGPDHPRVSYPLLGLARIDAATGDAEAAERAFRRVIEIRETRLGERHPDLAEALSDYAAFLRNRGRAAEATVLEERAGQIRSAGS